MGKTKKQGGILVERPKLTRRKMDTSQMKNFIMRFQNKTSVRGLKSYLQARKKIFDANANVSYGNFEEFRAKLNYDPAKCLDFLEKLKKYEEAKKPSIESDINTLDLSKHLNQISAAVVQTFYDTNIVPVIVGVCSMIHQRYSEFSNILLETYKKNLSILADMGNTINFVTSQLVKFSTSLFSGLFPAKDGCSIFIETLESLVDESDFHYFTPITHVMKLHGFALTGILPRNIRINFVKSDVAVSRESTLSDDEKRQLITLLGKFYATQLKLLANLREDKRIFKRQLLIGKLSPKRIEEGEEKASRYEVLKVAVEKFAFVVDVYVHVPRSTTTEEIEDSEEMEIVEEMETSEIMEVSDEKETSEEEEISEQLQTVQVIDDIQEMEAFQKMGSFQVLETSQKEEASNKKEASEEIQKSEEVLTSDEAQTSEDVQASEEEQILDETGINEISDDADEIQTPEEEEAIVEKVAFDDEKVEKEVSEGNETSVGFKNPDEKEIESKEVQTFGPWKGPHANKADFENCSCCMIIPIHFWSYDESV